MDFRPVSEVLLQHGIEVPHLNVLQPNETNYTALLLQPHGHIDAGVAGVKNTDRDLAMQQYGQFLQMACSSNADLVVSPEYSMPWDVLTYAIRSGQTPACGKLWVLGCESLTYSELQDLKNGLDQEAVFLFEALEADTHRFLDPLVYVFSATPTDGTLGNRTVMLAQFKTHAMADMDHFEVNNLDLPPK